MASYGDGTEAYDPDETLVVDLPYMGRVREMVVAIGGGADVIDGGDPSRVLNLTRFKLPGLKSMSAALRHGIDDARSMPSRLLDRIRPPADDDPSDLDRLLFLLRLRLADRNGGWVCEMGKYRLTETITGLPHLSGGLNGTGLSYPQVPQALTYSQATDRRLGEGVRVGVLDTRLFRHPELAGLRLEIGDGDWLQRSEPYPHWCGHGTFVLGLIAAQAPSVSVVYRGVLDDDHARANSWDVAHQIVAMRDENIQILNLSLGTITEDGQEPLVLSRAIQELGSGVVVVAAAGNHGASVKSDRWPSLAPESAAYPAADRGVIAVGALQGSKVATFTPKVSWLRYFAEGAYQQSTYLIGTVDIQVSSKKRPLIFDAGLEDDKPIQTDFTGYAEWAGTSMATAVVTGRLAALTPPGGSSFGALGLLPGPPDDPSTGPTSYTGPFPGPNPVKQAEDSLQAEEKWRSTED
jgi:membrane-anchored mycosin MYCP